MAGCSSKRMLTINTFEHIVTRHLYNLNSRCVQFAAKFKPIAEDLSEYLDIAEHPTQHTVWRKDAMVLYLRELPSACSEFLLAERVAPNLRILAPYYSMIRSVKEHLGPFYDEQDIMMNTVLLVLERRIRKRIHERDSARKIQIVNTYLSMHEHLRVERFSEMYFILLDVCTNPPLDSALTVRLIETLCTRDCHKLNLFDGIRSASAFETVILHAKEMRFDFWGLWSGVGRFALEFDFVRYFMNQRLDESFSDILIQYGFPYMAGPEEYIRRCFDLGNICRGVDDRDVIQSIEVFYKEAYTEKRTRMMLIMDTFIIFCDFEDVPGFEERLETLTLLNRSLPLPYVTQKEFYDTMEKAVVPGFRPELEEIASWYAVSGVIDGDAEISRPRSLLHLSRVAVRKALADNFQLLDGIQQLVIPEQLKPYLELEY